MANLLDGLEGFGMSFMNKMRLGQVTFIELFTNLVYN